MDSILEQNIKHRLWMWEKMPLRKKQEDWNNDVLKYLHARFPSQPQIDQLIMQIAQEMNAEVSRAFLKMASDIKVLTEKMKPTMEILEETLKLAASHAEREVEEEEDYFA